VEIVDQRTQATSDLLCRVMDVVEQQLSATESLSGQHKRHRESKGSEETEDAGMVSRVLKRHCDASAASEEKAMTFTPVEFPVGERSLDAIEKERRMYRM
jgi:hypothetical protein